MLILCQNMRDTALTAARCRSSGPEAKSILELYVKAVLASDDFDKGVFDQEHFEVYVSSRPFLHTNSYAHVKTYLVRHHVMRQILQSLQACRCRKTEPAVMRSDRRKAQIIHAQADLWLHMYMIQA